MSVRLKIQSITLAADEEARLPAFGCDGVQWVSLQIKTDQEISAWIAHGRRNTVQSEETPDVPAEATDDPASLPDATEAATIEANSVVEGGQGVKWELFGGPDVAQVVLHNTSVATANVTVKGRLW